MLLQIAYYRKSPNQDMVNYLNPDKMIYLVVGDAKTQLKPLRKLGCGKPILLDKEGNR